MSVILTVMDSQRDSVQDTESALNGYQIQDEEGDEENAREAELVVFEGTAQGLGLKICGGCSVDGQQNDGIFIKRILPSGLAYLQGGLEEGDLLLDVNGQNMDGVTYDRALAILRQASASNHVEIVITRDYEAREAFMDLMSRYGATSQMNQEKGPSSPVKQPIMTGKRAMSADNLDGFQGHANNFQKETTGLHSNHPHDDSELRKLPGKHFTSNSSPLCMEDLNCSLNSPASSCNSEMARHLPPTTPEPRDQNGDTRTGDLRSLDSVLSHSFPMAVNSVNPSCRFPVTKLEMTLQSLGFVISAQKHIELLKNIPIDAQGLTSFDDFVQAVRQVFQDDLQTRSSSQCSTPPLTSEFHAPFLSSQPNGYLDDAPLQQENDKLHKEIESLKEELKEQKQLCSIAEEQVLSLRKESQAAMDESRSLRTKLRLAEQSQEAARKMEQDYEQVVAVLENEISHLRLHMSKSDGVNEQRRLAVAACQLKKAESGKKTFEVATNKLFSHLQHVQDVLKAESSGSSSSRSGESDKGDKKKKKHKALQTLASEGQDVIRTVQTLIEQVPLPFGWEENYTADGVRYYINHMNQTTSWTHPDSNVEHQSITVGTGLEADRRSAPPAVGMAKRSDKSTSLDV